MLVSFAFVGLGKWWGNDWASVWYVIFLLFNKRLSLCYSTSGYLFAIQQAVS